MKNLSHSASFQPKDKIAPSNAGTKHLVQTTLNTMAGVEAIILADELRVGHAAISA
jgi:hypothetical protein